MISNEYLKAKITPIDTNNLRTKNYTISYIKEFAFNTGNGPDKKASRIKKPIEKVIQEISIETDGTIVFPPSIGGSPSNT